MGDANRVSNDPVDYEFWSQMAGDLLPNVPPFISRVCSGFGPCWGGLQIRSV
jgi:hypothetical protein